MFRRLIAACLAAAALSAAAGAVTLHRGNMAEPATLDPHKYTLIAERFIHADLFEGLVSTGAHGEPIPGIAETWDVQENGEVYVFHLREGLKWSDGAPLTADDVVAGLRRGVDPKTAAPVVDEAFTILNAREIASGEKPVETLGARALDERTVEIRLVAPNAVFPARLSGTPLFFPLPRHLYAQEGDRWTAAGKMVSNGPYMLAEWTPSERVRVVKNPHYRDAANVAIDEVIFYPTEDEAAGLQRFRSGELDFNLGFPPGQYAWLKQNLPAETRVDPAAVVTYITFNPQNPAFADARVRRALSLAIDRETITSRVLDIGLIPAYSFIPSATPDWKLGDQTDFSARPFRERLGEARALLAEAGYGPGKPLEFRFDYRNSDANKRVVVAIAAMWRQIGVQANLQANEIKAHYARLRQGDYEVADGNWTGGPAPEFYMSLVRTGAEINWGKWSNAEFDRLIAEASASFDPAVRAGLFQKADAIVAEEAPIAPIYFNTHRSLVHTWVKGFEPSPGNVHPSRFIRLEK